MRRALPFLYITSEACRQIGKPPNRFPEPAAAECLHGFCAETVPPIVGWLLSLSKTSRIVGGDLMGKRGRPTKSGRFPVWMLIRVTYVLYAYKRARDAGLKHFAATLEAVKFVRQQEPSMPISETEVKRILAEWRSNRRKSVLSVVIPGPDTNTYPLPGGRTAKLLFTAYKEPRQVYLRANAASESPQSKSGEN